MTYLDYHIKRIQEAKINVSKATNIPIEQLVLDTNPANYRIGDHVVIYRDGTWAKNEIGTIFSITADGIDSPKVSIKMISNYEGRTDGIEIEYLGAIFRIVKK